MTPRIERIIGRIATAVGGTVVYAWASVHCLRARAV
jgi:hypothetical protein